jgi:FYVE, RhoGEF and PH domain containing 5/6
VTSFPAAISSLTSLLTTNAQFSSFIAQQEADPCCGKLKLRDWLLTIVQRCPRYLLLLKDLINCTDKYDPEHAQLVAVHTLVSKSVWFMISFPKYIPDISVTVTISLNTSLHTHAQTLSLLALQRSTPNLPFQLITPGRTFLKRGSVLQLERSSPPKEREFLLFSDCLIWLASAEKGDGDLEDWDWNAGVNKDRRKSLGVTGAGGRSPMSRSRSRSEAELTMLNKSRGKNSDLDLPSESTNTPASNSKLSVPVTPTKKRVRPASSGGEERWWYKGKAELVDLEVVVSRPMEDGEERRFEVLSPETSFAVYACKHTPLALPTFWHLTDYL